MSSDYTRVTMRLSRPSRPCELLHLFQIALDVISRFNFLCFAEEFRRLRIFLRLNQQLSVFYERVGFESLQLARSIVTEFRFLPVPIFSVVIPREEEGLAIERVAFDDLL